MQPQPHVVTRGQDRVRIRGEAQQQPGERTERLRRSQLVEIVNNQRDVAADTGEVH